MVKVRGWNLKEMVEGIAADEELHGKAVGKEGYLRRV